MIKICLKMAYIIIILLIYALFSCKKILRDKFIEFKIYIYKKIYNDTIIEINLRGINQKRGPGNFLKGIKQVLPFIWKNCSFIFSSNIKSNIKPDLFFFPFPNINERQYNRLISSKLINKYILGPVFVPKHWNSFPNKNIWHERNFSVLLNLTKGIAVHSSRVRDYLINRTNIFINRNKFKIIRPCTNIKPTNIKSFRKRKIDILFFQKYADLNRQKQGNILLNLFKNSTKTVETIKYGNYSKERIKELANNSKFIIYFSFFDTGAIGLKEIQNYGVIAFSHQKEFIIDNFTSYYIPELQNEGNMTQAFNKIMSIIEKLSKMKLKAELIAKKNQVINNCENTLIDLCKNLNKI